MSVVEILLTATNMPKYFDKMNLYWHLYYLYTKDIKPYNFFFVQVWLWNGIGLYL